jgi:hypothetical protein
MMPPPGRTARNISQNRPVLFDVLEHVEGADDVELLLEGHPAGVHLEEGGAGGALARVRQPLAEDLGSRERQRGECALDAGEHEPGSTTDLQEAPGGREVTAERPDEEPIASLEPEIAGFQRGEAREAGGVVRIDGLRLVRGERGVPSALGRRAAARGAGPTGGLEAVSAPQAHLHAETPVEALTRGTW